MALFATDKLRSFIGLVGLAAAGVAAGAFPVPGRSEVNVARVPGPHLFVGEQYDISGGFTSAASFPIAGGLVRTQDDKRYSVSSGTLTTQPDGTIVSASGSQIDTVDPDSGRVLARLDFEPVKKNLFPMASQLHVDGAGRLIASFLYQNANRFFLALAFYPAGAKSHQAPYAVVPIPSRRGLSTGVATYGDAVYVSNGSGAIDIFAPIDRPRRIGEITGFSYPAGLAFDSRGELYVCNAGDGTVIALSKGERGPVKPDRIISVSGHPLCRLQGQFFNGGNEMAVSGNELFVTANQSQDVYELNATRGGSQAPMATIALSQGNNPWQGIDLAVGPR